MTHIRTVLPMACDGVGPSHTCCMLLQGMQAAGVENSLYTNRVRVDVEGVHFFPAIPRLFSSLPYKTIEGLASQLTKNKFIKSLKESDLAYLWPSADLECYSAARALGLPIIAEGINTRMEAAKEILDAAYAAEGLSPTHGITEERVREENEKLAMTDAIFAPSRAVEISHKNSKNVVPRILPSSYGVTPLASRPKRDFQDTDPVFLFVGYGCIRKGLHLLLRAWEKAKLNGTLVLAGSIEPALKQICAKQLERDDVKAIGFTRDVSALYEKASCVVLPSLEEGDPLVTYEAAAHGLPIVASEMGAGRIGADTGCVKIVRPNEIDTIVSALREIASSKEERAYLSNLSFDSVQNYSWTRVGARRVKLLEGFLE